MESKKKQKKTQNGSEEPRGRTRINIVIFKGILYMRMFLQTILFNLFKIIFDYAKWVIILHIKELNYQ